MDEIQILTTQACGKAQFPQKPLLQANPIEELLTPGDLTKPLSTLYSALLDKDSLPQDRVTMGNVAWRYTIIR